MNIGEFGFRFIQLEVNNTCNMRCSFCSLPVRKAESRQMDKDKVLELLESMSDYEGIDHLALHNFSEPLLNKDIWDYIDFCRKQNIKSQLVTNGLLLRKNLDKLFKHPPDILRISLQILDPAANEQTRGVKADYFEYIDQIAESLAIIIDEGLEIDEIRTDLAVNDDRYHGLLGKRKFIFQKLGVIDKGDPTIFDQTVTSLRPELISFLKKIERKSKKFRLSIEHLDENIERFYSQTSRGYAIAYDLGRNNMITYKFFVNGRKRSKYYPLNWASCSSQGVGILADGRVALCCQDYNGDTAIGNIFENNLSAILNQNRGIIEDLRRVNREIPFPICKKCLGCPTRFGSLMKNCFGYASSFT